MTEVQGWQELPLNRIIRMRSGDFISSDDIESEGPHAVYGGNGLRGFTHQCNTVGPIVLVGRQGAHCGNVHVAEGKSGCPSMHCAASPKKNSMQAGFRTLWLT